MITKLKRITVLDALALFIGIFFAYDSLTRIYLGIEHAVITYINLMVSLFIILFTVFRLIKNWDIVHISYTIENKPKMIHDYKSELIAQIKGLSTWRDQSEKQKEYNKKLEDIISSIESSVQKAIQECENFKNS